MKESIYCALIANLFACSDPCVSVIQLKERSVSNPVFIVGKVAELLQKN